MTDENTDKKSNNMSEALGITKERTEYMGFKLNKLYKENDTYSDILTKIQYDDEFSQTEKTFMSYQLGVFVGRANILIQQAEAAKTFLGALGKALDETVDDKDNENPKDDEKDLSKN